MRTISPTCVALAMAAFAAIGCNKPAPQKSATSPDASPGREVARPTASAASTRLLPFIEDDYARALADAKARGRLLFVDVWASWCHTCLSLKSFVLTDPLLASEKELFTWAAVDSEKEVNAALVERLKLSVLPTLWIIDPATEQPVWTWKGALTAAELSTALKDVRARVARPAAETRPAIEQAEAEVARGNPAEAMRHYRAALADPAPFKERGRAADAFVALLEDASAWDECVAVANREGKRLPEGTYRVDLAVVGSKCAFESKDSRPKREVLAPFVEELRAITTSSSDGVLPDDRSSAFDALVAAQKAQGDPDEAKKTAASWSAYLEAAAKKARSPAERAVFDSHRLAAYLELGEPVRALAMLETSGRDFPNDYNVSVRRARALFEAGRLDEALIACDRALGLAYGGRRLRIHTLKADVLAKKKDTAGERAALEAALADAKTMKLRSTYERLRKSIEERHRALANAGK